MAKVSTSLIQMQNAPAVVGKALQYKNKLNAFKRQNFMFCLFLFWGFQSIHAQYNYRPKFDVIAGSVSFAGLGTSLYLQRKVDPLSVQLINGLNRQSIHPFDRIATYQWNKNIAKLSDGLAVSACILPFYFALDKNNRRDFPKILNVTGQSVLFSLALSNGFKLGKRNRPFLYNSDVPLEEKLKSDARMSFFSAHTTTVSSMCFSFAFAYDTYHKGSKHTPYVYAGAIVVPAIEGFLRVKAGKHYPSDVIVGYLVGLGSSYLMYRIHRQ